MNYIALCVSLCVRARVCVCVDRASLPTVCQVPPLKTGRMHNSRFRVQKGRHETEEDGAKVLRQRQENRRSRFSIILEKVLEAFEPRGWINLGRFTDTELSRIIY